MTTDRELLELAAKAAGVEPPSCNDQDEDCVDVKNKTACWLYAMEEGMCPYLRAAAEIGRAMK